MSKLANNGKKANIYPAFPMLTIPSNQIVDEGKLLLTEGLS